MKKVKLDNENLKVGEKVWVCGKAETQKNGWDNSWTDDMNFCVGGFFTILETEKNNRGIRLSTYDDFPRTYMINFKFPLFVLSRNKKHVGKIAKIYEPKWKGIWK